MKFVRLLFTLCLFLGFAATARAHQIDAVEFEFQADEHEWRLLGEMDIAFMLPETRSIPGELPLSRRETIKAPPEEHERMRKATEATLRKLLKLTFAGKTLEWQIRFPDFEKEPFDLPVDAGDTALLSVRITTPALPGPGALEAHWSDDQESEFIAVREQDGEAQLFTTAAGGSTVLLNEDAPARTTIWEWVVSGFHHVIPLGLDHLFFILGLFLMLPKWKPLMGQSLLFTIAHSVTLALSVLGWVHMPGRLIEILIAASIAWIGIENLFVKKLGKQRLVIVFAFGLIHGCGFASVLAEKLGNVPRAQLTTPLLGFNIGVELAQITVLAIAFLVLWPFRKWVREIQFGGSIIVACAGLAWMIERIFGA